MSWLIPPAAAFMAMTLAAIAFFAGKNKWDIHLKSMIPSMSEDLDVITKSAKNVFEYPNFAFRLGAWWTFVFIVYRTPAEEFIFLRVVQAMSVTASAAVGVYLTFVFLKYHFAIAHMLESNYKLNGMAGKAISWILAFVSFYMIFAFSIGVTNALNQLSKD